MFRYCRASLLLVFVASPVFTEEQIGGDMKIASSSFDKCSKIHDWETCLRVKAVSMLDDAVHSPEPVVLNDFVTLIADPAAREDVASAEIGIEKALVEAPADKKAEILDSMIVDRMSRFFFSRSLQLTIPTDLAAETGRRKDKKGGMMMMAAMAIGAMLIQMMMGKVAVLAGKALLVGKMALLLSGIIALKKLVGGGGGESHHPQVIYATESHSGGGSGGGWGRRLFNENEIYENKEDHTYDIHTSFIPYAKARSYQDTKA